MLYFFQLRLTLSHERDERALRDIKYVSLKIKIECIRTRQTRADIVTHWALTEPKIKRSYIFINPPCFLLLLLNIDDDIAGGGWWWRWRRWWRIITDLSVVGEGGLLLPSGVVLPPLVLSLHLQGLLGLLSSILNEIWKKIFKQCLISSNLLCLLCSSTGSLWVCQGRISPPRHFHLLMKINWLENVLHNILQKLYFIL